jgi:hypothetical protein
MDQGSVQCDQCGHKVPVANLGLHTARCRRLPDQPQPRLPDQPQPELVSKPVQEEVGLQEGEESVAADETASVSVPTDRALENKSSEPEDGSADPCFYDEGDDEPVLPNGMEDEDADFQRAVLLSLGQEAPPQRPRARPPLRGDIDRVLGAPQNLAEAQLSATLTSRPDDSTEDSDIQMALALSKQEALGDLRRSMLQDRGSKRQKTDEVPTNRQVEGALMAGHDVSSMIDNMRTLSLSVDEVCAQTFAAAIRGNVSLTELELNADQPLSRQAAAVIARALASTKLLRLKLSPNAHPIWLELPTPCGQLVHVSLFDQSFQIESARSGNFKGISTANFPILLEGLKCQRDRVTMLDLTTNESLSPDIVRTVTDMLRISRDLGRLDLTGANIRKAGVDLLAAALRVNRSLVWLNLSSNVIPTAGAQLLFETLGDYNRTLRTLILKDNFLGDFLASDEAMYPMHACLLGNGLKEVKQFLGVESGTIVDIMRAYGIHDGHPLSSLDLSVVVYNPCPSLLTLLQRSKLKELSLRFKITDCKLLSSITRMEWRGQSLLLEYELHTFKKKQGEFFFEKNVTPDQMLAAVRDIANSTAATF